MARKKRILFEIKAPFARHVSVAGTFNGWSTTRNLLKKTGDTAWRAQITLDPGRHEYRFLVDGEWTSDPNAAESVPNPFGTSNSVITVT
jgi:1,4-alpha-glucan branching enzyme